MPRPFAEKFYNSRRWRKCRASFIAEREAIDGGLCQDCGRDGGYIVHHEIWLTPENIDNPEITLNHNNLRYVCLRCHNQIEEGQRRAVFDEYGNIKVIDEKER